jgi:hypothetical protein
MRAPSGSKVRVPRSGTGKLLKRELRQSYSAAQASNAVS